MAKVTVKQNFIGQPSEHEQFGGQTPEHLKDVDPKKLESAKNNWSHVITAGTKITVSDKRARELASLGIVDFEGIEKTDPSTGGFVANDETEDEKAHKEKKANEKVADLQVKEKDSKSGPNGKK